MEIKARDSSFRRRNDINQLLPEAGRILEDEKLLS
jgi:hypothetical protein